MSSPIFTEWEAWELLKTREPGDWAIVHFYEGGIFVDLGDDDSEEAVTFRIDVDRQMRTLYEYGVIEPVDPNAWESALRIKPPFERITSGAALAYVSMLQRQQRELEALQSVHREQVDEFTRGL